MAITQASPTQDQTTQNQTDVSNAQSPQLMQVLQQLAQLSQGQGQQNQPGMSMSNGQIGNTQGQPVDPQMQKSAQKALSQYYDTHAQQVLNHPHGLAALQFVANGGQQPPMSMAGGGMNQAGVQALQGMLGNQNATTPSNSMPQGTGQIVPPTNAMQAPSANTQTGNIQEGGWGNRALRGLAAGGPLGALMGLVGPSASRQMEQEKEMQVLKAGQPAEIAEPKARAGYVGKLGAQVEQAIEGKTPLQPSDLASITANINTLNLNSLKDASDKIENDIKNAQDISEFHQKTLNLVGRAGGWFNTSGQTIATGAKESQDYIKKLQTAKAQIDSKISNFTPTNYADQYKYKDITPEMAARELELRRAAGG